MPTAFDRNRRTTVKTLVALGLAPGAALGRSASMKTEPDLILHGGKFTTLDPSRPEAEAVAVKDGRYAAVGTAARILPQAGAGTRIIDLGGRRVIPGLIDSHTHVIRCPAWPTPWPC
jgi:adenine deaminase